MKKKPTSEPQPRSFRTTPNTIGFDSYPCECSCHTGLNIIHFMECCNPAANTSPYNGVYSEPKDEDGLAQKRKKKKK